MSDRQTEEQDVVLTLSGRIDASNAPKLEQDLLALHEQHPDTLIIDLSDVTYISSSGLRVLVMAHKRQQRAGGRLFLRQPAPKIKQIMTLCGLDQIFSFL